MSKTIEEILKNMPLDKDAIKRLTEGFNSALADAKVVQEASVRKSLTDRYDNDLSKIHEAFGTYLEERIKPHVQELQEGVESVNKMKIDYASKISKIKEAAQNYIKRRLGATEKVIENIIKSELSELHEDVVANRRATMQTITETRNAANKDREKFKLKAAKVIENIINIKVPAQLEPLREDIIAARQDNFGREIFEAFQTVFRRQHYNTSSELGRMMTENKQLKAETAKTKAYAARAIKKSRVTESAATKAYGQLTESVKRQSTINRLLKPLSGTPRLQMKTLLEATKTSKMDETFRKALPQVVREVNTPRTSSKRLLRENKATAKSMEYRSGGTTSLTESDYDEFDNEVADMRRLAGTKK